MKSLSKSIASFEAFNEKVLVDGLIKGREESFHALYLMYSDKVFRLAWRFLNDEDEAKNVVQETFLIVFRKIHKFRQDSSLGTWIYKIASNVCLKELSFRKKRKEMLSSFALEKSVEQIADRSFDMFDKKAMSLAVQAYMDKLDDQKKMTFLLFYIEEMTADEIAEILDEGRGTVLKRLQRLREELVQTFGQKAALCNMKKVKEGVL